MTFIKTIVRFLMAFALVSIFTVSSLEAKPQFSALTVDARTGAILFQNDADGLRHPASLTKMLTLYVLFQDLKSGRIKRSTQLRVSARAAAMPPSKLGLRPGSTISVDDAIKALVTKSANDVAATIGENLGGTESNFAARMTRVARSIGMSRSTFKNASGLPNPQQVTTARDMATLGLRLMRDYPQYYPYFRIQAFNFKGRTIKSHNRLVGHFDGTDGIKTGYIAAAGYNLVTSTRRGDKRLVGVVLGARSGGSRNSYMMVMLEKMFTRAQGGQTVAALAGSSKGVVNPLKKVKSPKAEVADTTQSVDNAELTAAAAEASQGSIEGAMDGEDGEDTASISEPTVLQADLAPITGKRKTPFAIKKASDDQTSVPNELMQSWNIQLGAFPTKEDAQAKLNAYRDEEIKSLQGKPAFTIAVQKGNKTIYRARFAGFDEASAKQACASITKRGGECLMVSPQG
jgi:D-alanyl-D-alanine carboxypeptidase